MAKETEQQTMEEYLLSQLDTPVVLKDGTMMTKPDGSPMTKQEAIATNILNLPPLRKGAAYAGVAASLHDTFSS